MIEFLNSKKNFYKLVIGGIKFYFSYNKIIAITTKENIYNLYDLNIKQSDMDRIIYIVSENTDKRQIPITQEKLNYFYYLVFYRM